MKTVWSFFIGLFASLSLLASPQDTANWQITPNPFITQTNIQFYLTEQDTVSIFVYNPLGQTVSVILNSQVLSQGNYSYIFYGDSLPDGTYFVQLKINQNSYSKHIVKSIQANSDNTINTDKLKLTVYVDKNNLLKINGDIHTGDLITIYSTNGKIIKQYFCKQNNYETVDISYIAIQILIVKITRKERNLNYAKIIISNNR